MTPAATPTPQVPLPASSVQPTTEMAPQALLAAANAIPADSPIYMVNLLRYREQADYGE